MASIILTLLDTGITITIVIRHEPFQEVHTLWGLSRGFSCLPSMNGIIYCRVSSKEQTQGTSLESQELACKEYARTKTIKILKVFVEQGESAKFADRTQLLELIEFCRQNKGKVQDLLVWKIDRFARNVGDHFNIKATLLKYGVRIVSVTEPIDSNPEGKLMETTTGLRKLNDER